MMQSMAPINAKRENLGRVVTIQVFELSGPDTIDSKSIQKFVGELISYQTFPGGFSFKIKGLGRRTYLYADHCVEIYVE